MYIFKSKPSMQFGISVLPSSDSHSPLALQLYVSERIIQEEREI